MSQSILSHTLDNGMVLVAQPMQWLDSAAFSFLVPAGAVYDPAPRPGLAGFTCEMALRGAGNLDSRRFVEALDNLGVERGESVSDSHTSFGGATLSGSLTDALSIYADVLRRPHFPADQLESGRQIVLQELQAVEDEPSHKVMLELRRRLYPPPWGRPSQGERDALLAITHDDIVSYFRSLYRPNGTILGVAGALDFAKLTDHVEQLFEDWKPLDDPSIQEDQPAPRAHHLADDTNQTQIGVAYPSVPYRDAKYFQAWGAVGALSGGMSARLFTEVRERRGLCYSVYASYHTLRDRGGVLCYAGTSAERAQSTLDVLIGELTRLAEGIEPHELDRLKARIKSALIMQQESSSARAAAVARDWYHLGRARTLDEVGAIIDELRCEEINAYLADNPPGDFTVVTLGPEPLELPVGVS